ncbi:MAG: hypothetical protein ACUVWP_02720 [bacterium]
MRITITIILLAFTIFAVAEWKDAVIYQKLAVDGGIEHKQGDLIKIIWNIEEPGELCIKKNTETIFCISHIEGSGSMNFDTSVLRPGAYYLYIHNENNNMLGGVPLVVMSKDTSLDVRPTPNPFDLSAGGGLLTFDGMPINSTLRIYDFGGCLVYKTENNNMWDGKNLDGELVSAGAYIFHIEYEGGEFIGRFAVIK